MLQGDFFHITTLQTVDNTVKVSVRNKSGACHLRRAFSRTAGRAGSVSDANGKGNSRKGPGKRNQARKG